MELLAIASYGLTIERIQNFLSLERIKLNFSHFSKYWLTQITLVDSILNGQYKNPVLLDFWVDQHLISPRLKKKCILINHEAFLQGAMNLSPSSDKCDRVVKSTLVFYSSIAPWLKVMFTYSSCTECASKTFVTCLIWLFPSSKFTVFPFIKFTDEMWPSKPTWLALLPREWTLELKVRNQCMFMAKTKNQNVHLN